MKALLIDTNIYTHALKGDPEVVSLLKRAHRIVVCPIIIGELLSGFKGGSRESRNREELGQFLDAPRVYIFPIDEDTSEYFADILNRLKEAGTPPSLPMIFGLPR